MGTHSAQAAVGKRVVSGWLAFAFAVGLGGCSAVLDGGADSIVPGPVGPAAANVRVLVLTPTRQPVAEATVTLSGRSATTDAQGVAELSVPVAERAVGVASKAGYVWGAVIARVRPDSSNFAQATVVKEAAPVDFIAEHGAILKDGNAEVILEPSAFQDSKGAVVSGWIRATMTPVRARDFVDVAQIWPLDAPPPPTEPGVPLLPAVPIYSGGMADLSFTAGGQPVQLRLNKPATLRLQLSEEVEGAFNADTDPTVQPLWFFDFADGYWHRDGSCTVRAGAGGQKVCEATVSHFTPWNVDWPTTTNDCVQVQVVDAQSKRPLPSAQILLSVVEVPRSSSEIADASGRSCLNIQSGWTLRIKAQHPGYAPSTEVTSRGSGRPGSACGMPAACAQVTVELCPMGMDCGPCPAGMTRCRGVCVDTRSNPSCCGVALATCGTAQACRAGVCECIDPMHTICGGACVNVQNDANHCGACAMACADSLPSATCQAGTCQCTGGKRACTPPGGKPACVDISSDRQHCGACNNVCSPSTTCKFDKLTMRARCEGAWTPIAVDGGADLRVVFMNGPQSAHAVGSSRFLFSYDPMARRFVAGDIIEKDMMRRSMRQPWTGIWAPYNRDMILVGRMGEHMQRIKNDWYALMPDPSQHFTGISGLPPRNDADVLHGFAAAEAGTQTQVYGNTWGVITGCSGQMSLSKALYAVSAVRNGVGSTVYFGGETSTGTRIDMDDKGACTWTALKIVDVATRAEFTIRAIHALTPDIVLATGGFGLILRSSDRGKTWQTVRAAALELNGLYSRGSVVYSVGNAGTIVRSDDSGATWTSDGIPGGTTANLTAVSGFGDQVIVVGDAGTAYLRTLK